MGLIVGALIFTIIPVSAVIEEFICYRADYKVMINGKEYTHDTLPILNYKGNTYAPFRSVLEAAGLKVNWNAELGQAEVITPVNSITMTDLDASTLQRATLNNLAGIEYNGVFYVETSSLIQNYGIVLNRKSDIVQIISKKTGQVLTLNQTSDGFIKDTSGMYYLNYNTIKPMIDTSDVATQPTYTPPTQEVPPITLSPEEVDALEAVTQDGMTGVMYNGVFYVEKDSFIQKYNVRYDNGNYKMGIHFSGDVFLIVTQEGKTVSLKNDTNGYLKSSTGSCYFNFNTVQIIIK